MQIRILPGKYIVAVSGGVDSVVLLHLLVQQNQVTGYRLQVTDKNKINSNSQPTTNNLELVVAHFNHGIREDSAKDERLVKELAEKYGLELEIGHGNLGPAASEARARTVRYRFLRDLKRKHQATAIITAHHQDDLIETAFLNILRGTGRRGLSAIADSDIQRPILHIPKNDVIEYAQQNGLEWREDSTNQDTRHLRNYVRQEALANLSNADRSAIINNIEKVAKTNGLLNKQIATLSHKIIHKNQINRSKFTQLPREVTNELIIRWLREHDVYTYDRKTVDRLSIAVKTAYPNTKQQANKSLWLKIGTKTAHFTTTD